MFGLISFALVIAAISTAFFRPTAAWIILSIPVAWMIFMRLVLGARRLLPRPELSAPANELFQRFGHYYAYPFVGTEYSSSASGVSIAAIIVGIIGVFKGNWWRLAIALLFFILASWLARQFNPTHFLLDERERAAHDEILSFLRRRAEGKEETRARYEVESR